MGRQARDRARVAAPERASIATLTALFLVVKMQRQ